MQRSTEMPRGLMAPDSTSRISRTPLHTTKQSKRLKTDMKYWRSPSPYILISISTVKRDSSTRLATSGGHSAGLSRPPRPPAPVSKPSPVPQRLLSYLLISVFASG